MKNELLTLATLAIAMTACSETEVLDNPQPEAIGFSNMFVDNASRADQTGVGALTSLNTDGYTFGVWGYKTPSGGSESPVFTNQPVTYNSSNSAWEYSPLKYWDKTATYTFCAYAPYQEINAAIAQKYIKIENVAAVGEVNKGTDYMIATPVTGYNAYTNPVPLTFKHLLTKVDVILKKDASLNSSTISVSSLKIVGFNGSNAVYTQETDPQWTFATTIDESGVATFLSSATTVANGTTGTNAGYCLVVPQTVASAYGLFNISYSVSSGGDVANYTVNDLKIEKNSGSGTTWGVNDHYVYTLTFGSDLLKPIEFTVSSVSDWNSVADVPLAQ